MYMRNIADIWTDIRIADIILNGSNTRADIPELGIIGGKDRMVKLKSILSIIEMYKGGKK